MLRVVARLLSQPTTAPESVWRQIRIGTVPGQHTFSAFWLRSSVVSVLISLISDTEYTVLLDINLIFSWESVTVRACTSALLCVASVLHCLRWLHTLITMNKIEHYATFVQSSELYSYTQYMHLLAVQSNHIRLYVPRASQHLYSIILNSIHSCM